MDLGFNPAWWIGICAALATGGIGVLVGAPAHLGIGLLLVGGSVVAAVIGFISISERRGWVIQSPLALSAAGASSASFPTRSILMAIVLALEIFVVGAFVGLFFAPTQHHANLLQSPFDEYQKQREAQARAKRKVPGPFSESDAAILVTQLTPEYRPERYKFQIIREENDTCIRFADSLSSVLRKCKWTEVAPPEAPAPGTALPLGITVRSSSVPPISGVSAELASTLGELGIYVDRESAPELRQYNYVMVFISDHGYLSKDSY